MKKIIFLMVMCFVAISANAQKWSELTNEQKSMQMQAFREDNQNYMKNNLKLTQTQMDDYDNVNLCYFSTLDRIDRYGKNDADKEKYAKSATSARLAQQDAIMGAENSKKFSDYVKGKLKKAGY